MESKPLHDSEAAGAFAGTRRAVPGGTVESHKAVSTPSTFSLKPAPR